jgi:two-component system sensor histidine kinase HydH
MAVACLILVVVLTVFVFSNYRREQRLRDEALEQKGRGVIAAAHTGLRVSLRAALEEQDESGATGPPPLLFVERMRQAIEQLQEDEDVRAIYLVDGAGQVLASGGADEGAARLNDEERRFLAELRPGEPTYWREESGRRSGAFLVGLRYHAESRPPFFGDRPPFRLSGFRRHRHMPENRPENMPKNTAAQTGEHAVAHMNGAPDGPVGISSRWRAWQREFHLLDDRQLSLLVVLDPERFNAAVRRQMWQIFALTATLLLVGLGGWLSLIAVQGWRGSQERLGLLERELRRHERLAALGKMAAGVAHELRNPLSSIKGLALILKEKLPEEFREDGAADLLIQEVGRLNRVIGDLLAYAKPPRLQKTRISLNEAARRALELIRPDALAMGVALDFSPAATVVMVNADADKLSQVLLNLLMNAMQAMEKMESGGRLSVTVATEDGRAKLMVADSGCGIAPENLPKIFDPYFTTKNTGTGLGLALSAQIIEEHGGQIVAHSQPGRGARLECFLPLAAGGDGA